MRKPNKPEFQDGEGGWVDEDRLSATDLNRLARYIPANTQAESKATFLRLTSEAVSVWELDKSDNPLTSSEIAKRIEKMEVAAKALQRAIEGLRGEPFDVLYPDFDYLLLGSAPPIELPEQMRRDKLRLGPLLEEMWEKSGILRETGEYARSHIKIDRTAKPTIQSARRLVFWIVTKYREQFGEYPAAHKTAWFPAYMSELGDILRLDVTFGFSMIAAVIEDMRKTNL